MSTNKRWIVRLENWEGKTIKTIVMREDHGDNPVYDATSALYKAFALYASKYSEIKKASTPIASPSVFYNEIGEVIPTPSIN